MLDRTGYKVLGVSSVQHCYTITISQKAADTTGVGVVLYVYNSGYRMMGPQKVVDITGVGAVFYVYNKGYIM